MIKPKLIKLGSYRTKRLMTKPDNKIQSITLIPAENVSVCLATTCSLINYMDTQVQHYFTICTTT